MDERPTKRTKHADGTARREGEYNPSTRSPRPHDSRREDKSRPRNEDGRSARKDVDRRRLSRSPRDDRRHERSRSRERSYRDRDRRDVNGHSRRDRSRSRDRRGEPRGAHPPRYERRHSRSRSPTKNGDDKSFRNRSPIKATRSDHDRPRARDKDKKSEPEEKPRVKADPVREKKPDVNGDAMAVDEDDEDVVLRKMMGFTSFKSTQNTKVPGNQIYGVRKEKKTEYRQYMNRVGGFNRPLSPSR